VRGLQTPIAAPRRYIKSRLLRGGPARLG
jgi:hypothetical protein